MYNTLPRLKEISRKNSILWAQFDLIFSSTNTNEKFSSSTLGFCITYLIYIILAWGMKYLIYDVRYSKKYILKRKPYRCSSPISCVQFHKLFCGELSGEFWDYFYTLLTEYRLKSADDNLRNSQIGYNFFPHIPSNCNTPNFSTLINSKEKLKREFKLDN